MSGLQSIQSRSFDDKDLSLHKLENTDTSEVKGIDFALSSLVVVALAIPSIIHMSLSHNVTIYS